MLSWGSVTGGGGMPIKRGAPRDPFQREGARALLSAPQEPRGRETLGHSASPGPHQPRAAGAAVHRRGDSQLSRAPGQDKRELQPAGLGRAREVSAGNAFTLSVRNCLVRLPRGFALQFCFSCHRFLPFIPTPCLQPPCRVSLVSSPRSPSVGLRWLSAAPRRQKAGKPKNEIRKRVSDSRSSGAFLSPATVCCLRAACIYDPSRQASAPLPGECGSRPSAENLATGHARACFFSRRASNFQANSLQCG